MITRFDPEAIMYSGQCFRMAKTAPGTYRALALDRAVTVNTLGENAYAFGCDAQTFEDFWASYFDLSTDYGAVADLIDPDDAFLRCAAAYGAGLRILRQDPWEALVSFIISQRKSIPAIRDCVARLCAAFGKPMADGLYAFPAPQSLAAADESALLQCALGYRAPYVLDAARAVAEGRIDLGALDALDDGELLSRLMALRGVGVKVAHCAMLFGYHRLCASPVDVWIQRVIDEEYGGKSPFARYGAYAGIMQQYMFFYRRALSGKR